MRLLSGISTEITCNWQPAGDERFPPRTLTSSLAFPETHPSSPQGRRRNTRLIIYHRRLSVNKEKNTTNYLGIVLVKIYSVQNTEVTCKFTMKICFSHFRFFPHFIQFESNAQCSFFQMNYKRNKSK